MKKITPKPEEEWRHFLVRCMRELKREKGTLNQKIDHCKKLYEEHPN